MTHTPAFEEMQPQDWPQDLKGLHQATTSALDAYAELDWALAALDLPERGPVYELAAQAWALYRDLQMAGMRRYMEWEQSTPH